MIIIDINNKEYKFELTRSNYLRMLQDKEFSSIEKEILDNEEETKNLSEEEIKAKAVNDYSPEKITKNLIYTTKVLYYSLLKYQPEITKEEVPKLLDDMIDDEEPVDIEELMQLLLESFTKGESTKKKRVLKIL